MEPRAIGLNLTFLTVLVLFVIAPCHSLPSSISPQPHSKPGQPSSSTGAPSTPPIGRPKAAPQPDDLLRSPPGKLTLKDPKHRHSAPGKRPLAKNVTLNTHANKKRFDVGKKLGVVFAGIGVALQVLFGGFLIYKRLQLREDEDASERIPPPQFAFSPMA